MDFDAYLRAFEERVVLRGLSVLGRTELVPMRNGRLVRTLFGRHVGVLFSYPDPVAIDYYGLYKKSSAVMEEMKALRGRQVRMIEAVVVHFASIRIEQVALVEPGLVAGFPAFKERLLRLRGFTREE